MNTAKSSDSVIDTELAAWLRRGSPSDRALKLDRSRLLLRIDLNRVGPMLALQSAPLSLPKDLKAALRQRLIAREMWEAQHKRVLVKALDALTSAGLTPVLMKGTALAYSHYERPAARVRGDSDILIEEDGRLIAFDVLTKVGFIRPLSAAGAILSSEAQFYLPDLLGQTHDVDLHWRLNSSPIVARLYAHRDLHARAQPIENEPFQALRLNDIDALIFAAVHRRLHIDRPTSIFLNETVHPVIDSLSWLMDIHLLYSALDAPSQKTLLKQAINKKVADILADALRRSSERCGTDVDETLLRTLEQTEAGPISKYIAAGSIKAMMMNLSATHGITNKITFLRELFFPSRDYMLHYFSRGKFDWLAVLYVRRLLQGIKKHVASGREVS